MNRELLIALHQEEAFKLLLGELKGHKPVIPIYDPEENNIEQIKVKSGELKNYNLMMAFIEPWRKD